jgi:hypothetical protein
MVSFEEWWKSRFPNEVAANMPVVNQAFKDVAREAWDAAVSGAACDRIEDERFGQG